MAAFPAAATVLLSACTLGVQWKNHASFRTSGKELRLSHIDADEAVEGVISANLHYSVGENALLSFDNVAVIEPFLYTGQNFTIALGEALHDDLVFGGSVPLSVDHPRDEREVADEALALRPSYS